MIIIITIIIIIIIIIITIIIIIRFNNIKYYKILINAAFSIFNDRFSFSDFQIKY